MYITLTFSLFKLLVFNLKSVGGFRFMTNIEGCSKIVFEPNIPEIEEFRKK